MPSDGRFTRRSYLLPVGSNPLPWSHRHPSDASAVTDQSAASPVGTCHDPWWSPRYRGPDGIERRRRLGRSCPGRPLPPPRPDRHRGFGRVDVADDVRLRRKVAVKVLHSALADDAGFLRRFRTEAQLAPSRRT